MGCHRRAFGFFSGIPAKVMIDNLKAAITKASWHDPEVQRSYAECAEGYGFLVSPCPPRDPKKKDYASYCTKECWEVARACGDHRAEFNICPDCLVYVLKNESLAFTPLDLALMASGRSCPLAVAS